jgi:hypothetical protein
MRATPQMGIFQQPAKGGIDMGSKVVREEEREFKPVDWGRSKTLFGPDDAGKRNT